MMDRRNLKNPKWEPRIDQEDYTDEMVQSAMAIDAYPLATNAARRAAAKILCTQIIAMAMDLTPLQVQKEALAVVKRVCPRTDPAYRNRRPTPALFAVREYLIEQGDLPSPNKPNSGSDDNQSEKSPELL